MNDRTLLGIGQLARHTGLPVRTLRFWSDAGLVPPTERTPAGYRRYDAEAVARVELVRTLRELGIDLDTVRRVLAGQTTPAEVAAQHVRALDTELRVLRLRRAVLRVVARRGGTTKELRLVNDLARLSAQQRQRIIDDFVAKAFDGVAPDAPGAGIADAMRTMPAELPDDPSDEQVDAWVELAELVADEDFQARVRQMAVTGTQPQVGQELADPAAVLEHAGAALAAGVDPATAQAKDVLHRIIDPAMPAGERAQLADTTQTFTDRRVERYWQLLGTLNGRPPFPARVPAFEWFIAALRSTT